MADISRRRLLGTGLTALGAAAAASVLPPNLRRVLAEPPQPGGLEDIEHVVVLMQENRSFDHYFGTLPGVRGFDDPDALTLPNGNPVFYQPDAKNLAGYLLPFHLDTTKTSSQAIPSTGHAFTVQHDAVRGGKMDNWLPAHRESDGDEDGPYTMGYYTRADLPFHFALAESFTICDSYFSSVLGPTWPNRLYLCSASIDPNGTDGGPVTSNVVKSPYTWRTYPERLTEAGVSWHVYQQENDYGCNVLELFQSYQDAAESSPLHQHGLTIGPADQFERDALADRLPTVSWIVPTARQCEHPDYTPASGADFIARQLDAVAANPEVWKKTVFVLNYDENDGLFDHAVPPMPEPGTRDEFVDGLAIGGGIRVPCVLVSPWTQGGMVASEPFDHTSVLRLLEQVTGVREPNITEWRRHTFGDLTSALGMPAGQPFPALPPTTHDVWKAEHGVATLPPATIPGEAQSPPHQEHGNPAAETATAPVSGAPAPFVLPGSRTQTKNRVTETLTNHRADFPAGVAGTSFPGIPVAAGAARTVKTDTTHTYVATIAGEIAVIDTGSRTLVRNVKGDTDPYAIASTPDATKLLITNSGASDVSVLDPVSEKLTGAIGVGLYPHGIVVTPDGKWAYVANTGPDTGAGGSTTVSVVDIGKEKAIGQIHSGLAPHGVALTPDAKTLYVTCYDGVSVVDTTSGIQRALLSDQARSNGVTVSPDGGQAYVANCWENTVSVLDTASNTVTARIPVGKTPWNVAFGQDGTRAYVTNANEDTVSVIDTSKRAVIDTVRVGHIPTSVRAHADTVWVSNNASATVTTLSAETHGVLATTELGLSAQPAGIAMA